MALSQAKLAQRFESGHTTGSASNVTIQEAQDGSTLLVGYGHAVYAERTPSGLITVFEGWANSDNTRNNAGTQSTKCQFSKMGLTTMADTIESGDSIKSAPKVHSF